MPQTPRKFRLNHLEFELEEWSGWVRNVRWRDVQILNAAYCGVRTENWGTSPVLVSSSQVDEAANRVSIRIQSSAEGMPFAWFTQIEASPNGLSYVVAGQPTATMKTRRTGLCVLHPTEGYHGAVVDVRHVDSTTSTVLFPDLVLPGAPFEDLEGLTIRTIEALPGENVQIGLGGEIFSTEDQRNWTDASLKTYCHPQSNGQIYEIRRDEPLRHEVKVAVVPAEATLVRMGTWVGEPEKLRATDVASMASHGLSHVAFRLSVAGYKGCQGLGLSCHLYASAGSPVPTDPWPDAKTGDRLVLQSPDWNRDRQGLIEWRRWAAQHHFPVTLATAGSFVELNRKRPPVLRTESVGFAMDAAVHSRDVRSIMETPRGLADCMRTAMTFGGNGEVVVGPIGFAWAGRDDLRRAFLTELRQVASSESLLTVFSWDGEDRGAWQS